MGDYGFNASKLKKKPAPQAQAEKLASPPPSPSPSPTASPSPKPKTTYKGTYDSSGREGDTTTTKAARSDKNVNVNEHVTERHSSTPAVDAKKKAERMKTLGDEELKKKADDGDFEARFEVERRAKAK